MHSACIVLSGDFCICDVCVTYTSKLVGDRGASRRQTWDADSGLPHLLHRPAFQGARESDSWPGVRGRILRNKVGLKWPAREFRECSVEELDMGVPGTAYVD